MNENLQSAQTRMTDIFKRAGIPVKRIVLTRVTVIVELHGQRHAERVASLLKGAGYTDLRILDNRPSIYRRDIPPWRVTGIFPLTPTA